ncbi:alpha/beta hydrolase [Streptomyces sp. NPDC048629]|uniref:alpha/beta fold hydrolase n=1 Tax=Streptomyces sp. NPDC048629 TaxID=3154824 RepID=UPI00341C8823
MPEDTALSTAFSAAYDAVLAKWPAGTSSFDVPTPFGTTHVHRYGPDGAPPLLLLPGGGATSTGWYGVAAELGRTHRLYAADLIGDPGRSVPGDRPLRTADDLSAWLDALYDGLGLTSAALCGHSYGAWIALHHALRAPDRVGRLVLLDPTNAFTGFTPRYLLRALPMLLRPAPARNRAFLAWETSGAPLDPAWRELDARTADFPTVRPVTGPRPRPEELRRLAPPTLLLLAEHSRAHDVRRVAARARAAVPRLETVTVPGATHHTLPPATPPDTLRRIAEFLAAGR